MARIKQTKPIHQMTIGQWEKAFPTEAACDAYLIAHRWPGGVQCPRCGSDKVYPLKTMEFKWECPECREGGAYRFSHLVGTIFENTKVDLRQWFRVIHMILTAKKGVAALEVMRVLGFGSYKTAHYMCHRIRLALMDKDFQELMGVVEVDETFIGGKAKNRHKDKRGGGDGTGGVGSGKAVVVGAVSRRGNLVARVIADVRAQTLETFVAEAVSTKVDLVVTDKWVGYKHLNKTYKHGVVDHARGEYVVGALHTNTIEGFWSIMKRGIVGTYHMVSAKYLPLYVAEFQFRHNNRMNENIFETAIAGC